MLYSFLTKAPGEQLMPAGRFVKRSERKPKKLRLAKEVKTCKISESRIELTGECSMDVPINPFTPTFGIVPPIMAGRTYLINDVVRALDRGPGDPNLATIYVGARGTGKTALLSYLSSEAQRHGWISVGVAAAPGMLEDIYEQTREVAAEYIDSGLNPRLRGLSVGQLFSVEWEPEQAPSANWRTRMTRLIKALDKYDIGLLFTIDEVSASFDEMISFASTYQMFVREGRRVGVLMAGLPHQVSMLLRNQSVSFLRRSVQHHLGNISDKEIAVALKETIEGGGRRVSADGLQKMVDAIGGFPFLMQLVGFRSWDIRPQAEEITVQDAARGIALARSDMEQRVLAPTYYELSEGDKAFLEAMLADGGESKIADVAERMGVKSNYASQYRARLIEQGIIGERGRGRVGFDLPYFKEYLEETLAVD